MKYCSGYVKVTLKKCCIPDDRQQIEPYVLAGAPRYITDKLQRVLNAAARLVTGTRKFDRGLERLLHDDLHWLDVPERQGRSDSSSVSATQSSPVSGGLLYVRL